MKTNIIKSTVLSLVFIAIITVAPGQIKFGLLNNLESDQGTGTGGVVIDTVYTRLGEKLNNLEKNENSSLPSDIQVKLGDKLNNLEKDYTDNTDAISNYFRSSNSGGQIEKSNSYTKYAGLGSSQAVTELALYPNPALDMLWVEFSVNQQTNVEIKLITIKGKVVYNESISGVIGYKKSSINVSQFGAGIYFLQIINDNSKISKRVVIK